METALTTRNFARARYLGSRAFPANWRLPTAGTSWPTMDGVVQETGILLARGFAG